MHFWDLPEDIFLDILALLGAERERERHEVLKSLRLTSKRLAKFTESAFFNTISIKLDGSELTSRLTLAANLGQFVKKLNLDLWVDTEKTDWAELLGIEERDDVLAQILRLLPNVQDLTLHALRDWRLRLPKITKAFEGMSLIQSLQVMEISRRNAGLEPFTAENVSEVLDKIITQIIQSSGKQLRYLSFDTRSSISTQALKLLRTEATNLRAAVFREYIGLACRDVLCEDVPWACRDTLQYLSFLDCRGAHGGAIACGIVNGLWARNLQWLEVSTCGKTDDVARPPYPIQASDETQPTVLNRAHYEHEILWELDLLGKIPVRSLTLTKVDESSIITLLERGAFPSLERLDIESPLDMQPRAQILAACDRRRVKFTAESSSLLDY